MITIASRLKNKSFFIIFAIVWFSFPHISQAQTFINRSDVRQFVDDMVSRHGFNGVELIDMFSEVQVKQDILDAMSRPAESKPWYEYRKIFLTASRIEDGVAFWQENASLLQKAEDEFGVPAQIIVAIIGVETRYGHHQGRHRVLDALATLAFEYPKRGDFFQSELEQYLLLAREEKFNPLALTGSYAGAMGMPQFIASSYRHYAVDFDGDGTRDLLNDKADVIGSVANYFKLHFWHWGEPVVSRVQVKGDKFKKIAATGIKPTISMRRLAQYGIKWSDKIPESQLGALIELQAENGPEYWVGLHNFYVITRYNHSPLYAMAVYQLSEEIKKRRQEKVAIAKKE
jgi:membrane-bound lytic murein transglycosylase B